MKCRIFLCLILFFLLIPVFNLANHTYSASSIQKIIIKNQSSLSRSGLIIQVPVPEQYKENRFQISEGTEAEINLDCYLSKGMIPSLFTQIDLKPLEEKTLYLRQKSNQIKNKPLNQTTQPGTEYLFVNYKRAVIVSTEQNNAISIFSDIGKLLNTDQKPLILDKGKFFVLESSTPKLVRLLSDKPIFVFESTLKEFTNLNTVEPGDSDTTTLYGSDLFFFTEKHLWISSYEKTKVSIYDSNDLEIWSDTIEKNTGIFKNDLKRGAYYIKSEKPITIQFGYLDDENFSILYGTQNLINGFSFGDLMVSSLYPNTTIDLQFGNEKITKKHIQFKQAGMTQIIPMIEKFEPQNPEYIFVSIKFNNPIQVFTFSSGNNFGGEYISGVNGLFSDKEYSFVTLRVSKEYSKEQKNLIELIGLENDTEVSLGGSLQQKIVLQSRTTHWIQSNTPMEKINLYSNKSIQVSQIHNFNTKGLFYWVPPVNDTSISIQIKVQDSAGIFQSESKFNQGLFFLFNQNRFQFFLKNIKSSGNLPITVFFLSLLILISLFILLLWLQYNKIQKERKSQIQKNSVSTLQESNSIEEKNPFTLIKNDWKGESKNEKFVVGDIKSMIDTELFTNDIPKLSINPIPLHEEKLIPMMEEIKDSSLKEKNVSKTYQNCYLDHLKLNKVVLDPGSANRLYMEGKLFELKNAYIVKTSAKKISIDVSEKLNKIDLNLQDLSKANVYKESLSTFDEAGKALSLCKKLKINYYITSYKLPSIIQGIHVIHITDTVKET